MGQGEAPWRGDQRRPPGGGGPKAQAAAAGLQGRKEPRPHSQPSLSWTQLISLLSLGPNPQGIWLTLVPITGHSPQTRVEGVTGPNSWNQTRVQATFQNRAEGLEPELLHAWEEERSLVGIGSGGGGRGLTQQMDGGRPRDSPSSSRPLSDGIRSEPQAPLVTGPIGFGGFEVF